jgi:hypothetical protein
MVKTDLLPAIGIMASRTVDAAIGAGELPLMLVLVTGLTARIRDAKDHSFRPVDDTCLMTFLTENVSMAPRERKFTSGMIKLHDKPAFDIVTAGTALLRDACVELSCVRILVARLAGKILPCEALCILPLYPRD